MEPRLEEFACIVPFVNNDLLNLSTIMNDQWKFYHCDECGYWTSRTVSGDQPVAKYDKLPDYNINYQQHFDKLV